MRRGLVVAVVNARWAKPLDADLIRLARSTRHVVTIEDHVTMGGLAVPYWSYWSRHDLKDIDTRVIGLPDKFVEHGAPTILRELYGLSSAHIKEVIREQLHANQTTITKEINW